MFLIHVVASGESTWVLRYGCYGLHGLEGTVFRIPIVASGGSAHKQIMPLYYGRCISLAGSAHKQMMSLYYGRRIVLDA